MDIEDDITETNNKIQKKRGYQEYGAKFELKIILFIFLRSNLDCKDLEDIESKLKRLKLPSTNKVESSFEIRIKSVAGQVYQIKLLFFISSNYWNINWNNRVEGDELVVSLKNKLESCIGTPFTQIRLIYNGRVMSDLYPLNHYKISESSIIHMVYALRGGFKTIISKQ